MKVDIHCHTSKYSPCAGQSPENMVEAAIRRKMDGVVITEHDVLWKKEELEDLRNKYPQIVILNGVEISSYIRIDKKIHIYDILVYGLLEGEKIPKYKGDIKETLNIFQEYALVLPHPFRKKMK